MHRYEDIDQAAGRQKRKIRFPLLAFDQIAIDTRPSYLIKGWIPRVGLTVVWGPPKCGKSYLISTMMLHVALNWKFRGQRVQPGAVVYCSLEAPVGFMARLEAFRQQHLPEDAEPVPFYLSTSAMKLMDDHTALIADIKAQLGDVKPVAVVLDTLARAIGGSESGDEDMARFVNASDAIRDAFQCAVIVVHHSGWDTSRMRGHSGLPGAMDAEISVKRDGGEIIVATVENAKDFESGARCFSKLEQVIIGIDDEGDDITSCVIVESEGSELPDAKLSDKHKLSLAALDDVLISFGSQAPASMQLPAGIIVASIDKWRDALFAKGIIDPDQKNPRVPFQRLKEKLEAKHLIGTTNSLVWSARKPVTP